MNRRHEAFCRRIMKILAALLTSLVLAAAAVAAEPQFDAAATSLPPKFAGNDFERVFAAFNSGGPKGEFESTAEYEARKAKLPAGKYAFVLPLMLPPKYDADKETFTFSVFTQAAEVGGTRDISHPAFVVKKEDVKGSTHKASNALGVTVTVTSREVIEHLLISRRQGENVSMLTFDVKVPRDEAPALKPRLKLLLVTQLDGASVLPPGIGIHESRKGATGLRYLKPTISAPQEVSTYEYALSGDVLGLWAFDEETGRVLGKFDPTGKPVTDTTAPPRLKLSPMQQFELQQKIKSGMTKEQVTEIMGGAKPDEVGKLEYAGELMEVWSFRDAALWIYFSLKTGKVEATRSR